MKLESGEFAIQATAQDIMGFHAGTQVLSLRSRYARQFADFRRDLPKDMLPCSYEQTVDLLSLAGPYTGIREQSYSFCEHSAHPNVAVANATFDLRSPEKPVAITAIFPERAVLEALMNDSVLKPYLKTRPVSLRGLAAALPEDGIAVRKTECTFELAKSFDQFAIHHVERDHVAVRISLIPIASACRGITADIGILLPATDELRQYPIVIAPPAKTKFTFSAR